LEQTECDDVIRLASALWMLSGALQAQDANPLSSDAKRASEEVKTNILRSAEKLPDENYDFRLAPRVRTFGQILGHIAQGQYLYFSALVKGEQESVEIERTVNTGGSKSMKLRLLWMNVVHDESHYGNLGDPPSRQGNRPSVDRRPVNMILSWVAYSVL
jgi:hypothetical protein